MKKMPHTHDILSEMELTGIEPATSRMRSERSTTELQPLRFLAKYQYHQNSLSVWDNKYWHKFISKIAWAMQLEELYDPEKLDFE